MKGGLFNERKFMEENTRVLVIIYEVLRFTYWLILLLKRFG